MEDLPPGALGPLFIWLSPSFPTGGFAYSHGLEWAVECGDVRDADTLEAWLDDLLVFGSLKSDAALLSLTYRAAPFERPALNDLALALTPSSERHLETASQGRAFLLAVRQSWPADTIEALAATVGSAAVAYPVALGTAAAAHGLPLAVLLQTFLLASLSNLISAVVRLGPIGQTDAQMILARLIPKVTARAEAAVAAGLKDVGTSAWRSDIAAMRHETQYSRLFRS